MGSYDRISPNSSSGSSTKSVSHLCHDTTEVLIDVVALPSALSVRLAAVIPLGNGRTFPPTPTLAYAVHVRIRKLGCVRVAAMTVKAASADTPPGDGDGLFTTIGKVPTV